MKGCPGANAEGNLASPYHVHELTGPVPIQGASNSDGVLNLRPYIVGEVPELSNCVSTLIPPGASWKEITASFCCMDLDCGSNRSKVCCGCPFHGNVAQRIEEL